MTCRSANSYFHGVKSHSYWYRKEILRFERGNLRGSFLSCHTWGLTDAVASRISSGQTKLGATGSTVSNWDSQLVSTGFWQGRRCSWVGTKDMADWVNITHLTI